MIYILHYADSHEDNIHLDSEYSIGLEGLVYSTSLTLGRILKCVSCNTFHGSTSHDYKQPIRF